MISDDSSSSNRFATSYERMSQLNSRPVGLVVKLPIATAAKDSVPLTDGLRELYRKGELTDVSLVCAGQTFLAHRIVLAAQSAVFRQGLRRDIGEMQQANTGREEVRLADVSKPEAVKLMLDYMYQMNSSARTDYDPLTQEINIDVLRLARNFQLAGLSAQATQWLAKDVTTGNVFERLKICDDFGLQSLSDKIIEQLTLNRLALSQVAMSPQIIQHPKLLQALLQRTAAVPAEKETCSAAQTADNTAEERKHEDGPSDGELDKAENGEHAELTANTKLPSDLPGDKVIALTGKVAATPYIAKRTRQLAGLTVERVLTTENFLDASDERRKYRVADLRYDLKQGFLALAPGTRNPLLKRGLKRSA